MSQKGRAEYWIGRENGTIPETLSMKEYLGGPEFWWPQLKIVLGQMQKESNKSNQAIAETILDLMDIVEKKYPVESKQGGESE